MDDPCADLFWLEDGSVRVICRPAIFETSEEVRSFAFDAGGRPLTGWPVTIGRGVTVAGRMIGDELTLAVGRYDGVPKVSMQTIAPDGTIRRGADVSHECCYGWAVAPDGIAYGSGSDAAPPHDSRITAVDPTGERPGWPIQVEGQVSAPAFAPDGRIVVLVGPFVQDASRVLVFGRGGTVGSPDSADLPLSVVPSLDGQDVDCGPSFTPRTPLVGSDGTVFAYSELDDAVFAVDSTMAIRPGWPFDPATGLQYRSYLDPRAELSCGSYASPAVGPDSTLYMPLQARDESVAGGSLVAVGPDGRQRAGWPIVLQRDGAEFWSVAVGSDGIVFALAIEPEPGDTFSASILAIAPDSTVLYATTIIDP